MPKKISLKQFLMRTGKFEKSYDCINAIRSGKVTINNKTITIPNYFFNSKKSLIKFNNERLRMLSKFYFIMNKPAGYLSQKSPREKSIYDLLEKLNLPNENIKSLFAIGRLDKDTEGLLILTNDGRLVENIMRPENDVIKKYYATLENRVNINKTRLIEKGIQITSDNKSYKTKPSKIKVVGEKEVYISITEGKKRQIRNMFNAIGNKVVYLKRVSIGGLQLGNLKVGQIKQLTKKEIIEKLGFNQYHWSCADFLITKKSK